MFDDMVRYWLCVCMCDLLCTCFSPCYFQIKFLFKTFCHNYDFLITLINRHLQLYCILWHISSINHGSHTSRKINEFSRFWKCPWIWQNWKISWKIYCLWRNQLKIKKSWWYILCLLKKTSIGEEKEYRYIVLISQVS